MELLAVIAIIGLLVAVLLPALGNVRTQSKRIECLAHLKSLGSAVAIYSDAHRGMAPTIPLVGSPNTVAEATARLDFPNSPAYMQIAYFAQSSIFTRVIAVSNGGDLDRETCPSHPGPEDLSGNEWFRFNGRVVRISSYIMSRAFVADAGVFESSAIANLGQLRGKRVSHVAYPSSKVLLFETRLFHEPEWLRGGAVWSSLIVPMIFTDGHGLLEGLDGFSDGELAMNTKISPSKLFDTPKGVLGRDLQ